MKKEKKKITVWQGILIGIASFLTGVGVADLFNKYCSPLAKQNQALRVKNTISDRRIKFLENKSLNNFIRGIKVGREMETKKD